MGDESTSNSTDGSSWPAPGGRCLRAGRSRVPGILRADGYVPPSWVGKGLGSMLLELTDAGRGISPPARCRVAGSSLHNTTLLADAAAQALLERAGYRAVNWSYRMAIELREAGPARAGRPGSPCAASTLTGISAPSTRR